MTSPFERIKHEVKEIQVGEDKIKVKPKVEDAEAFILMKKDLGVDDVKKITTIMIDLIVRANPEEDPESIRDFVAINYGNILSELTILFGFATRAQVQKAKDDYNKKKQE